MTEQEILGTVKSIAKSPPYGIKLLGDDQWYNPIKEIQDRVISKIKAGIKIKLIFPANGKAGVISDFEILDQNSSTSAPAERVKDNPSIPDDKRIKGIKLGQAQNQAQKAMGQVDPANTEDYFKSYKELVKKFYQTNEDLCKEILN